MSTTFFAPDAQAATKGLEINMASANAAELTVFLDLDTHAEIDARGMVAGEASALVILAAIRQWDTTGSGYLFSRMCELRTLAEAAEAHNSIVAWA